MEWSNIGRYFLQFNSVMIILVGCSFIALTIFFERLFFLHRSEIDTNQFILSLRKVIEEKNYMQGIALCERSGGPVASMVRIGLMRHNRPKEDIVSSMEVAAVSEVAKLEKNARILSIIAHIAPLIGLLGTVLGFISAFAEMRIAGLMDISISRVGESMEYALVTTAAGLVVAIPSLVAYNYLVSRIHTIVLDMQTVSSEVVDLLTYEN